MTTPEFRRARRAAAEKREQPEPIDYRGRTNDPEWAGDEPLPEILDNIEDDFPSDKPDTDTATD